MTDKPGKWIYAQFPGKCGECFREIQEGDQIYYVYAEQTALCEDCGLAVAIDEPERNGQ